MIREASDIIQKEMREKTGELNLGYMQITEMPEELVKMVWLKKLFLYYNDISVIKGLERLTNLQVLNLDSNWINEIEGLEGLANLQELFLNGNQIREIEALEGLTNLQKLDLGDNRIKEIKGLERLTNLQELYLFDNQISEIKGLEGLTKLQVMYLNGNQISEIKGLEGLMNLRLLYLNSNQISEIKGLEGLTNLKWLFLHNNRISYVSKLKELISIPALKGLYLFGIEKNNLDIPAEKFGTRLDENCLPLLRAYFEAIQEGAAYSKEVPVILLGNATAGKTSLRYFLKDKIFPPPEDQNCSTHGIEPDIWQPPQELLEKYMSDDAQREIQIYFWDFGGQEYYHATHRLFLSKEAIYILVWDKSTDKQGFETIKIKLRRANGVIEEVEQPVELFPYEYWLKTIRFFAPDAKRAPVILVQNKLDEAGHQKEYPDHHLYQQYGGFDVLHLSLKDAYASRPKGMAYHDFEGFLRRLLSLAEHHLTHAAREKHWEGVKSFIRQHKEEKIWSPQELLAKVQQVDAGINELSLGSYINSLSSNGFIFYYPDDDLKDHVFIDPGWVTEVIYDILDETVLRNNGEFDREHVVEKIGATHAPVFIALMKKFELIFEDPETQQFIAPQYLPERLGDKKTAKRWSALKDQFSEFARPHFYLHFPGFLPPSIMLRFLSVYGPGAIEQYYWKSGIAFRLEKKEVVVTADYAKNLFRVFVQDGDQRVQRLVFHTLHELTDYKDTIEIGLNGEDYVRYNELKKYRGSERVATVSDKMIACAPFHHFIKSNEPLWKQVNIFISYAHEDEHIKDLLVNTHLAAIQNHYDENLLAWTDAEIKPGSDWDHKIKREIENADIIIFLVTSNFLASGYIKNTEISNALERFKQRKQIILPVYIEEVSGKLLPFKEKQYLPGGIPLKSWESQSSAWTKVQDGIITVIDAIRTGNTNDYFE